MGGANDQERICPGQTPLTQPHRKTPMNDNKKLIEALRKTILWAECAAAHFKDREAINWRDIESARKLLERLRAAPSTPSTPPAPASLARGETLKEEVHDMTAREQLAAAYRELYDWTLNALPLSRFEGGAPVAIQRASSIRMGLAANGQKKQTRSPQFFELIAGIDRAVELAGRLTSAGPKCCNVSCSETHEIADFIHDVANMLVAMDEPLKSAALTPGDVGGVGQELVECRECLAMAFEALAQAGRRFGYIASGCSPDVANPTVGAHEAMDVFRMIDVRMSKYPAFSKAWIATPPAALPPPSPDAKLGEDAREVIAALNGYKEVCTQAQRFEEAVIYSKAVKLITAPTRPAAPSATERNV